MKVYKFLLKDYKAMHGNFQYAIGKTYVHEGHIGLCKAGFHASKETRDAIQYCNGSHLVEVELGGDIIRGVGKIVASEITILRELDIVRELEVLAGDESELVRCAVVMNPNTPVEILETLSDSGDWHIRRGVAKNPNTPSSILEILVSDEDWSVRCGVAENLNTPVETLNTLTGDEDWRVRREVALNPNTPIKILETLAGDENWSVRRAATNSLSRRKQVENESM